MKARGAAVWGLWIALAGSCIATTYHCDPGRGSVDNPGSKDEPWGALEEVIARGMIGRPGAVVKAGDTVLLHTGYHGQAVIQGGHNDEFVTIAAAPGARADVAQVVVRGGSRWRILGLRVSPELAHQPLEKKPGHLVQLGEHGDDDCAELVVEDCFIFSVADASAWSAADWVERPSGGIWLGRHGRGHVARNNYILNTRMGIDLCAAESLCEGNVIDGFSGDGIRVTRDGCVVRHNVIRNNFVGDADGDPNHDDGIQCFLFNRGRGLVRDVTIEGNLIVERDRPGLPLGNPLQGIGFFDGPLVNFTVKDNVVRVNHWHGITLADAQGCRVTGNTCYNPDRSARMQPWVRLGQKQGLAKGNTAEGNLAHSFNFDADPEVRARDNLRVTAVSFKARWDRLVAEIHDRFDDRHMLAGRPRVAQ